MGIVLVFWQWDGLHDTTLLVSGGIHLSHRGKRVFAQELAGLMDKLDLKGRWVIPGCVCDKLGGDTLWFKRQS